MENRFTTTRMNHKSILLCLILMMIFASADTVPAAQTSVKGTGTGRGVYIPDRSHSSYADKESSKTRLFYNQLDSYSKEIYRFLNKKDLKKTKLTFNTSYKFSCPTGYVTCGDLNDVDAFATLDKKVLKGIYAFFLDHMEKCYFLKDLVIAIHIITIPMVTVM